ncbi:hypothetical protein [Shivajiella indica]|uniref:Glycosyltransferase RgtA/B/C/D-like domain-containing protein n=1 Tax=Shivajiella indica TaxID=872115 RepID=A0ABW5B5W8_9BACT
MISFFRINDPFRLFALLGLMIFLSAIYLWVLRIPLLQPELTWMLLGERLADGKLMYRDVLDDSGPFSAGVYWLLHMLFGKSFLIYKISAGVLIFVQIIYLNSLFIRYKSFDEITYIPAFVLSILVHLSFDILTLSPALMGCTFIVFALGQLFSQTVLQKEGADSVLLLGIYGGIAACFHFPLIFFLPYMLLAGIVVSGFTLRQFLLSIIGYIIPLLICSVYFFWFDSLPEFLNEYILTSRSLEVYVHVRLREIVLLYFTPLMFGVIGILYSTVFKSFNVNQQKQMQLMLIYLIFGAASIFLANRRAPYQWIILIPGIAYFISLLFISIKTGVILQVLSTAYVILVPLTGYTWTFIKTNNEDINSYIVNQTEQHQFTKGKKVLVLGNDLAYYLNAKQVTPFLNYHLSKEILTDLDNFENLAFMYKNFTEEIPEIIIDEEGVFAGFLEKAPLLQKKYKKSGNYFLLE